MMSYHEVVCPLDMRATQFVKFRIVQGREYCLLATVFMKPVEPVESPLPLFLEDPGAAARGHQTRNVLTSRARSL